MRQNVTTLLDVAGLVLIAAGAGLAVAELIGPAAVAVSGVVLLAGSWLAARQGSQ